MSFDADSYSHNVEVRSGDAESGASCVKQCSWIFKKKSKLGLFLVFVMCLRLGLLCHGKRNGVTRPWRRWRSDDMSGAESGWLPELLD